MQTRELISKSDFVRGIAILWIMLYHAQARCSLMPVRFLQDIGYGGVDLFLLLSGFGCYLSLERNPNPVRFLKRRMARILPAYLPFILLWMGIRRATVGLYFTDFCGSLTMTGVWNDSIAHFNWFPDALLLYYILLPYICGIQRESRRPLFAFAGLLVLAFLVSGSFLHSVYLLIMSRLPVLVAGAFLARLQEALAKERRRSRILYRAVLVLSVPLAAAGFAILYWSLYCQASYDLWHYGLYWYPFFLIAPCLVFYLGKAEKLLSRLSFMAPLLGCVRLFGRASFELFLCHVFLFESMYTRFPDGLPGWQWALLYALALVIGLLYRAFVQVLTKALRRIRRRFQAAGRQIPRT